MKQYKPLCRVAALLLACVFLFSACAAKETVSAGTEDQPKAEPPRYTQAAQSVTKTETVFVNLQPDGSAYQTTVTDWLHTDSPEVFAQDMSTLKGIHNVKGDTEPVTEGESLTWHMESTDLYYSGTTEKSLPVQVQIQYFLDGKPISPKALAGKSGKLRMVLKLENRESRKVKIEGKKCTIYTPMIVAGGFILPEEVFRNVTLENAKIISDGSRQIAVLLGVPGMNESLQLDKLGLDLLDSLQLAEEFTLEADVSNFAMSNMLFAVLPLSSLDLGLDLSGGMDDITEAVDLLHSLQTAIAPLSKSGVLNQLLSNPTAINELMQAANDAIGLYQSNKVLLDLLGKYMTEDNMKTLQDLLKTMDSEQTQEALALLQNPALQLFFRDLPTLAAEYKEAKPLLDGLAKDMADPKVQAAMEALPETLQAFAKLQKEMEENSESIQALQDLLADDSLSKIGALLDGVQQPGGDIAGKYGGVTENANEVIARMNAWLRAASEYTIFTETAQGTQSSVSFVYETDSMQPPKAPEQTATAEETALPWWKQLFQ